MTGTVQEPAHPLRAVLSEKAWDWPTIGVFAGCVALYALALLLPAGWWLVQWPLLVVALTLHSSLTHEILHWCGPVKARVATVLGTVQPGLFVPYMRFKDLHLAHHRDANLTDPYDDPESHYLDPAVWHHLPVWRQRVLRVNNTLLGRIVIGPLIGMISFAGADVRMIRQGDRQVAWHWLLHVPGVVLTLWWVSLSSVSLGSYLLACYGALAVLRIRTYLEHRAHEKSAGRTVIIEDRGILAFLFLNNNFHAVHHMHPQVAWHRLPGLYAARKERFLAVNRGYAYRSYGEVFARYSFRAKDPVAHPLWPGGDS